MRYKRAMHTRIYKKKPNTKNEKSKEYPDTQGVNTGHFKQKW